MTTGPIADWDDAYENAGHIDGAADYPPRWEAVAKAFRDRLGGRADVGVAYGDGARNVMDVFSPEGAAAGLVIFVHGGYWRRFDRTLWSWLAAGPLARGWAVAAPSYTLVPEVRIGRITKEVGRAVETAAARTTGPIRLVGHSAGGHLASRMICEGGPLSAETRARIANVVSISGVHDLRPLLGTAINDDLHLDAAEAAAESPALLAPMGGARITCWVGADERPEFVRQSALLANIWTGLGAETQSVEAPGRHHFDVIDELADADSGLCGALFG